MENQKQQLSNAAKIAQFRLALIAPVIHGLFPDASRNAYYRRITEKPLTLPDGSIFQYSPKTISKWVSLYQTGGIDALMPKERSDKGATRVLPDTAIEEDLPSERGFPQAQCHTDPQTACGEFLHSGYGQRLCCPALYPA